MMIDILVVAVGGALGAVGRHLIGTYISKSFSGSFPMGTFFINVMGCFLMGLLMSSLIQKELADTTWRLFLCVGVLGGFTTFSSFGYEALTMLYAGKTMMAGLYAGSSVIAGLFSAGTGMLLARMLW